MASELSGKSAIVTGAGRGIGRAIALALAAEGARVALLARTESEIRVLAEQIERDGGDALPLVCDVAEADRIASAVAACAARFERIDVLVNNAGVFLESMVEDMAPDDWERVMRVNATGPFLLVKAVLPLMKAQGGGKIVNISSTSGVQGYLKQSAYCASKHALLGFSKCLALEVKPHNIHVHTVCPGGVRTDFIAGTYLSERLVGQTMLEPGNVAELVTFLARQPDNVDIAEVIVRRCNI